MPGLMGEVKNSNPFDFRFDKIKLMFSISCYCDSKVKTAFPTCSLNSALYEITSSGLSYIFPIFEGKVIFISIKLEVLLERVSEGYRMDPE